MYSLASCLFMYVLINIHTLAFKSPILSEQISAVIFKHPETKHALFINQQNSLQLANVKLLRKCSITRRSPQQDYMEVVAHPFHLSTAATGQSGSRTNNSPSATRECIQKLLVIAAPVVYCFVMSSVEVVALDDGIVWSIFVNQDKVLECCCKRFLCNRARVLSSFP